MNSQIKVDNSKTIENYEEYLSVFFPELKQVNQNSPKTPEEIGIKMAKETLAHINELLNEK